jgi:hypothetical protein
MATTNKQATKLAASKRVNRQVGAKYPKYTGLSADERTYLNELIDQGRAVTFMSDASKVDVQFWVQGRLDHAGETEVSFTVAILRCAYGKTTWTQVGVAKRNCYDDQPDDARGRRIALARAARGEAVQT